MQDEVISHLTVQFDPIGKIKMNMLVQNIWLYPRKEYAAPNLRDKHWEKVRTEKFLFWFVFVSTDCKLQCQDMSWVFSPHSELYCTGIRYVFFWYVKWNLQYLSIMEIMEVL